jgi:hypothetical protein
MYFATLVWPTSMPSESSSPWMRGAPQSGLARLMPRISRRISSGTLGLPPRRPDFQRQNDRNPAWCQRTTVSGRTMVSASNVKNDAIQPNEHQTVEGPEDKSLRGFAPERIDLLPENKDFCLPHSRAK